MSRALLKAIRLGNTVSVAKKLEETAINPNERDVAGATPIMHAAWWGHVGIVEALISSGANPNVVELLLARGAAPSAHKRNRRGFLPRELGTDANPVRRFIQTVLGGRSKSEAPSVEEMATPRPRTLRALGTSAAAPGGGASSSSKPRRTSSTNPATSSALLQQAQAVRAKDHDTHHTAAASEFPRSSSLQQPSTATAASEGGTITVPPSLPQSRRTGATQGTEYGTIQGTGPHVPHLPVGGSQSGTRVTSYSRSHSARATPGDGAAPLVPQREQRSWRSLPATSASGAGGAALVTTPDEDRDDSESWFFESEVATGTDGSDATGGGDDSSTSLLGAPPRPRGDSSGPRGAHLSTGGVSGEAGRGQSDSTGVGVSFDARSGGVAGDEPLREGSVTARTAPAADRIGDGATGHSPGSFASLRSRDESREHTDHSHHGDAMSEDEDGRSYASACDGDHGQGRGAGWVASGSASGSVASEGGRRPRIGCNHFDPSEEHTSGYADGGYSSHPALSPGMDEDVESRPRFNSTGSDDIHGRGGQTRPVATGQTNPQPVAPPPLPLSPPPVPRGSADGIASAVSPQAQQGGVGRGKPVPPTRRTVGFPPKAPDRGSGTGGGKSHSTSSAGSQPSATPGNTRGDQYEETPAEESGSAKKLPNPALGSVRASAAAVGGGINSTAASTPPRPPSRIRGTSAPHGPDATNYNANYNAGEDSDGSKARRVKQGKYSTIGGMRTARTKHGPGPSSEGKAKAGRYGTTGGRRGSTGPIDKRLLQSLRVDPCVGVRYAIYAYASHGMGSVRRSFREGSPVWERDWGEGADSSSSGEEGGRRGGAGRGRGRRPRRQRGRMLPGSRLRDSSVSSTSSDSDDEDGNVASGEAGIGRRGASSGALGGQGDDEMGGTGAAYPSSSLSRRFSRRALYTNRAAISLPGGTMTLREVFDLADLDEDGLLDEKEELRAALVAIGLEWGPEHLSACRAGGVRGLGRMLRRRARAREQAKQAAQLAKMAGATAGSGGMGGGAGGSSSGGARGRRATVALGRMGAGMPPMIRRTSTDGGFRSSSRIAAIPEESFVPDGSNDHDATSRPGGLTRDGTSGRSGHQQAGAGELTASRTSKVAKGVPPTSSSPEGSATASNAVLSIPNEPLDTPVASLPKRSATPPQRRGSKIGEESGIEKTATREPRTTRGSRNGTDWFRHGVTFVQYSAISETLQRHGAQMDPSASLERGMAQELGLDLGTGAAIGAAAGANGAGIDAIGGLQERANIGASAGGSERQDGSAGSGAARFAGLGDLTPVIGGGNEGHSKLMAARMPGMPLGLRSWTRQQQEYLDSGGADALRSALLSRKAGKHSPRVDPDAPARGSPEHAAGHAAGSKPSPEGVRSSALDKKGSAGAEESATMDTGGQTEVIGAAGPMVSTAVEGQRKYQHQYQYQASAESVDMKSQCVLGPILPEGAAPPPLVFLGGGCNPTTWRFDAAIPRLLAASMRCYNPQVEEWDPSLIQLEETAKQEADVLLFVIGPETRAVASMIEVAELAADPSSTDRLVVVVEDVPAGASIGEEKVGPSQLKDLNRGRAYLAKCLDRHGVPAMSDVGAGVEECIRRCKKVMKQERRKQKHILKSRAGPGPLY